MAPATETLKPPVVSLGVAGWLRKNLFSNWFNSFLTVIALAALYGIGRVLWEWITTANWAVVTVNLRLFMVGRYPADQVWRVQVVVSLLAFLIGASWGVWRGLARTLAVGVGTLFLMLALLPFEVDLRLWLAANVVLVGAGFAAARLPFARRLVPWAWLLSLFVTFGLLYGFGSPVPVVATNSWGGLLLTMALAVVGIAASFPVGVALAVGRQSDYPAIRGFSVLFIEVVRGVPLVTILFMAQILLPIFLPEGVTVENVVRAMVGFTLFTAAYLAEVVRGGLQSIGRGQGEAARAVGLSGLQALWLIILPQALRAVIPALVGQFISLFKDTSLVAIVGLLDLTGIGNSVISQRDFLNTQREVYLFLAAVYFVGAYSMSYVAGRVERSLGVGER